MRLMMRLLVGKKDSRRQRVGAILIHKSPRALLRATVAEPRRTHLSIQRYGVLTASGLALAAVQVLLMPRWLSPRQFGLVVLSISATQAVLQLGDLGLVRLSIDATRSPDERSRLRQQGRSMTLLSTTILVLVVAILWPTVLPSQRPVLIVVVLGGISALAVVADKFRAAQCEVDGDEVAASGYNFMWTNSPKIGLLVGVLFVRAAAWIGAVGVLVACTLSPPSWPGYRDGPSVLRRLKLWGLPFVAIVSSFVLTWSDTFFLSAHVGVARAGAYEALYRVMGVSTYGFLPWVSVLTSRVSAAENRPLIRPLLLSLAATATGLLAAVLFVVFLGKSIFPRLHLPLDALPALVVLYMFLPVSFCLGSALYVRSRSSFVTFANAFAALVALFGHVVFTLHGGPASAAAVSAVAWAVAVGAQAVAYVWLGPGPGNLGVIPGPGITSLGPQSFVG